MKINKIKLNETKLYSIRFNEFIDGMREGGVSTGLASGCLYEVCISRQRVNMTDWTPG